MASLGMEGPYVFYAKEIDRVVTKTSFGNYALGHKREDGTFVVQYVGRSDSDVNKALQTKLTSKYNHFKYCYATSAKEAFEKECRNYHDFGCNKDLDNICHPVHPADSNWKCPVCSIFG